MMIGLIRFCRGYVDFNAKGKFPERFLNMTSRNGVNLWNAHPIKQGLEGSMYISDYKKIRKTAKKSKIKTKITAKHGLPFLAARYKNRIGLLIGAVIGVILLVIFSNFIWSVKITGAESVSTTKIAEELSDSGVKIGGYKNNLDVQKICRDTMLNIKEIGWMSINITGNTASVEIKEKTEKPDIKIDTNPSNIKARCDGVITKIKTTKGTTKTLVGSGVAEGDLLVSGIAETKMNTLQYVHATAEVYADVFFDKELQIEKNFTYYSLGENKTKRYKTEFLWSEFPCSISFKTYENSVFTKQRENLTFNNEILPVGIKAETETELIKSHAELDKTSAESSFKNLMLLYEIFEKSESKVVSRKTSLKEKNNRYFYEINYVFNENIAENVDFNVTE